MISLRREKAVRADKIRAVLPRPPEVPDLGEVSAMLARMTIGIFDWFHGFWGIFRTMMIKAILTKG